MALRDRSSFTTVSCRSVRLMRAATGRCYLRDRVNSVLREQKSHHAPCPFPAANEVVSSRCCP